MQEIVITIVIGIMGLIIVGHPHAHAFNRGVFLSGIKSMLSWSYLLEAKSRRENARFYYRKHRVTEP